ncbi:hypothetical protein [Chryseobacterium limigenitum]|uniref:Uncharacterized protein n=1 Tax=Chryseobacterium limigenitum TaxID=1612149 RepID=A0A1K2ISL7_9FLAO|nr:hypothetical protein [Chryseobacterium limigenitum]SFZ95302.1 hypothetical protein SAMN05216324_10953 [Chryseobacterium limigenitum]
MSNTKFHFVKYEFGTINADNDHEACQLINNPFVPKESKILSIISKKVGTPVFPNLEHQELIDRITHLETAIIWKAEHFEKKAKELEHKSSKELYDRSLLEKALYEMIKNHNRDEGISWSTVEYYLNAFCKKG